MAKRKIELVEEVDLDELNEENEAIVVLKEAEAVLIKRIGKMKIGKPRYAAQDKLKQIQTAIGQLKIINT